MIYWPSRLLTRLRLVSATIRTSYAAEHAAEEPYVDIFHIVDCAAYIVLSSGSEVRLEWLMFVT